MRTLLKVLAVIVVSWAPPVVAQSSFELRLGGAGSLGLGSVPQATGTLVAASALQPAGARGTVLVALNATGQVLSETALPVNGRVFGQAFVPAAGGGGYVVGSIIADGALDHDLLVMRIDAQGGVLWTLTPAMANDQHVLAAAEAGSAGLHIAGTDNSSGSHDALVGRVSSSGTLQWTAVVGGPLDEEGLAVAGDANGALVTGRQMNFSGESDALFFAVDATGTVLWSSSWGGVADEVGNALVRRSNGTYVMAGTTASYGPVDQQGLRRASVWLMALESDGDTLWTRTIGDTLEGRWGHAVAEAPNGDLLVAGGAGLDHNTDALVLRRSALGAAVWERRYDLGQEERLTHIHADATGFRATGRTFDGSGLRMLVLRKNGQGL